MKLSKRQIDNATCREDKTLFLWDGTLSGFGVRLLPSGAKRYVVKYRSYGGGRSAKQRSVTIGTHGQIPFDQAKEHARQILAAVKRGADPQGERQAIRGAPKLVDAWEKFQREELANKKSATIRDYTSCWERHIGPKLGSTKTVDVSRSDVSRLHQSLSDTPYLANRMLALLSSLMNKCEAWEWREQGTNPCRFVKKFEEQSRERYLSGPELERLGKALRDLVDDGTIWPDVANLIKLLLLTGARRNEVATCEWDWIDWERQVILLPDSKTGAKPLFLGDDAIQVLESQKVTTRDPESSYVFPGKKPDSPLVNLSKPWKVICEAAELTDIRIHDLRHTAASIAVGQGVALPIIGRLLGHTQTQTTARYAHVDSDPALAAANAIGMVISRSIR
ncbi:site-specific integrase [Ruegeria atlantica]|uniref:Site-specific tyrosine recombinase XerC n=1 Tax=Ruegeria atlantica TaxID=81569 RepID=A0A0P1EHF3_9RHOB|nr:site-specific integrase [Ruegeria atlantica]CUH49807.1 site-specific tyrosine recombinase XerC [Ruegeria atlantica]